MQFQFSVLFLAVSFAVTVVASPVIDASLDSAVRGLPGTKRGEASTKRSTFDDCFNEGFQDGEIAGCNAASNGGGCSPIRRQGELPAELQPRLECNGDLANAFNEGFNSGFNDGFNKCS
ncbi:hypothetical protein C8J56DRAFT_1078293 [Mycena floridula]|nr:hypothetical protein C8J56DRAFT_1078293 [Mycena floridula]